MLKIKYFIPSLLFLFCFTLITPQARASNFLVKVESLPDSVFIAPGADIFYESSDILLSLSHSVAVWDRWERKLHVFFLPRMLSAVELDSLKVDLSPENFFSEFYTLDEQLQMKRWVTITFSFAEEGPTNLDSVNHIKIQADQFTMKNGKPRLVKDVMNAGTDLKMYTHNFRYIKQEDGSWHVGFLLRAKLEIFGEVTKIKAETTAPIVKKERRKDGVYKTYYEKGVLKSQDTYVDELKEGDSKIYYPTGNLRSTQTYLKGKLDGMQSIYYETGEIKESSSWTEGKIAGQTTTFYPTGEVMKKEFWDNQTNQFLGVEEYDRNGNLLNKKPTEASQVEAVSAPVPPEPASEILPEFMGENLEEDTSSDREESLFEAKEPAEEFVEAQALPTLKDDNVEAVPVAELAQPMQVAKPEVPPLAPAREGAGNFDITSSCLDEISSQVYCQCLSKEINKNEFISSETKERLSNRFTKDLNEALGNVTINDLTEAHYQEMEALGDIYFSCHNETLNLPPTSPTLGN